MLVSGGGDDFLALWDWPTGQEKCRIDLKAIVEDCCRSSSVGAPGSQNNIDHPANHIAVSSIHCLASEDHLLNRGRITIVVSIEG